MQIYLAPMEGITGYIFRNALHKHYGGVDKFFTPFLANRNMNYKEMNDICPEHNQGINLVPQILANQADVFLEITKHLESLGYKEVNLNLGCPSGTVVSRKRGAGFLSVPDGLDAFLEEIFTKSKLPISIKTRIGMEDPEEWERILSIYEKYPMTELIIHPRFQKEFYKGRVHFDAYLQACERMKVPLCYNGDITDLASLEDFREQAKDYSFERIMIGRGAIANPGLAESIRENIPNEKDTKKDLQKALKEGKTTEDERIVFRAFHDDILKGYEEVMSGDQPVLFKMKELWVYMGPFRGLSEKDMKQLRKTKSLTEYKSIINRIL